jgi:hypothetical protein
MPKHVDMLLSHQSHHDDPYRRKKKASTILTRSSSKVISSKSKSSLSLPIANPAGLSPTKALLSDLSRMRVALVISARRFVDGPA